MTAGQLAALIAAGFFALLVIVACYVLLRIARLLTAATGLVTGYRDRADTLIEQAQAVVDRTNEQLDQDRRHHRQHGRGHRQHGRAVRPCQRDDRPGQGADRRRGRTRDRRLRGRLRCPPRGGPAPAGGRCAKASPAPARCRPHCRRPSASQTRSPAGSMPSGRR